MYKTLRIFLILVVFNFVSILENIDLGVKLFIKRKRFLDFGINVFCKNIYAEGASSCTMGLEPGICGGQIGIGGPCFGQISICGIKASIGSPCTGQINTCLTRLSGGGGDKGGDKGPSGGCSSKNTAGGGNGGCTSINLYG